MTELVFVLHFLTILICMMRFLLVSVFVIAINSVTSEDVFNLTVDNAEVLYPNEMQNEFKTKCYPDVGCFYTGPPWYHPLYRPVSVPPDDTITTLYLLYTRKNKNKYYNFYPSKRSLAKSNYRIGKPVKVLIHGYAQTYRELLKIKDELLRYADLNVFAIDWSKNAGQPVYQAVSNSRVTGARIANMLKFLIAETGLKPADIHLIGKSLGGQVVGYVGQRIKYVGRITGLDPAGPYFRYMPNEVQLDMTDADFVDSIHTNAGMSIYQGEGILGPIGHADYYPNGGNHMPECGKEQFLNLSVPFGFRIGNQCSHDGSQRYFNSSIRLCNYVATACSSYNAYLQGICKNGIRNQMGLFATKPEKYPLSFYIDTSKIYPHCQVKK